MDSTLEFIGQEEKILISQNFTYFPRGTKITENIEIPGDMKIGHDCQLVGDLIIRGNLDMESEVQVFGDLEVEGDLLVGENVVINGNIRTEGDITIHHAARITGNIRGRNIHTTSDTIIDGTLKGEDGIRIMPEGETSVEDRMERFDKGVDEMEGII